MTDTLLQVRDLTVSYHCNGTQACALSGVTFEIASGEATGLLGESGCGKSTTALALLRLLPGNARIGAGTVLFRGRDLLAAGRRDMERIRGAEISLIFQEPSIALNPVLCVGEQVAEVIRAHQRWEGERARSRARELLDLVRLGDIYRSFPHELSGGQKQRILIAQALACKPALIVADEPTTGLDTRTRAGILDLFRELKTESRTAFLFISHHPGVLAGLADRLMVMYAGRIVEQGGLDEVYRNPLHPYTRALLGSMPETPGGIVDKHHLSPIPGAPPDMSCLPPGCPFERRCSARLDICATEEPPEIEWFGSRRVRCHARMGARQWQ